MHAGDAILWIHAICGGTWVAASAAFVIAGLALEDGSDEQRNFVAKVAPRIDGLAIAAASVLVLSGMMNLAFAAASQRFRFSPQFDVVLGAKIAILILMLIALGAAVRARRLGEPTGAISGMVRYHGAIVILGGLALLLGLWLMGT